MKKILSLLLTFVFLNVSSWAYAPNYGGGLGPLAAEGTYAGVFIPSGATALTTTSASIGVFAVGIPGMTASTTVFSQGAGVVFSNGAAYVATINGVFDPESLTLSAILDGVSNFTIVRVLQGVQINTNIFAQGSMSAKLTAASGTAGAPGLQLAQRPPIG